MSKSPSPPSFFGDQDAEQVIEDAKSKGVSEATVNDDGSVTYKMSKATHEKMMKEMKDQAVQSIEELKNGEDFTSIKDITYNDQLSEFTMVVDRGLREQLRRLRRPGARPSGHVLPGFRRRPVRQIESHDQHPGRKHGRDLQYRRVSGSMKSE